jgi:hypothetical protein
VIRGGSNNHRFSKRITHNPTSAATHVMTTLVRTTAAVEIDIPTPVASMTYAATQAGHLGISARTVAGKAHFVAAIARRVVPQLHARITHPFDEQQHPPLTVFGA